MAMAGGRPLARGMLPNPVAVQVPEGQLTWAQARDLAHTKAQELQGAVMLVAWCDQTTGTSVPSLEC